MSLKKQVKTKLFYSEKIILTFLLFAEQLNISFRHRQYTKCSRNGTITVSKLPP